MISDFMLCFGLTVCILLLYILLQIFNFYVHSINTTMRLCTSDLLSNRPFCSNILMILSKRKISR